MHLCRFLQVPGFSGGSEEASESRKSGPLGTLALFTYSWASLGRHDPTSRNWAGDGGGGGKRRRGSRFMQSPLCFLEVPW